MEAVAYLRNVSSSPRKMGMVAAMIRGQKVKKALGILKFEARNGAKKLEKLLVSAVANWQATNPESKDVELLYVKTVFVTCGKMLKRLNPAPQGRAYRVRKRSNHVTLVVDAMQNLPIPQTADKSETKTK